MRWTSPYHRKRALIAEIKAGLASGIDLMTVLRNVAPKFGTFDPSGRSPALPKQRWEGRVLSVQPRIRLTRSFDEFWHTYLGYVVAIEGRIGEEAGPTTFHVAISPKAQEKHQFRVGEVVKGVSRPVEDPELETAAYYKTSGLKVINRSCPSESASPGPPFHAAAPGLGDYRTRGHRRLDARTYATKCTSCVWGCSMPVEIIVDQWSRSRGPDNVKRRFETFCYGPEDCTFYRAGPTRKVPGRRGMVHEDEGRSRG